MNFEQFQYLFSTLLAKMNTDDGRPAGTAAAMDVKSLPPLVLAYVGDAFFTLFVRSRLLAYEQNRVRVLHTFDARMVSAVMQASAVKAMENSLSDEEHAIIKRGRNTKSTPTKNASVSDYRYSTGFEALLGYLYLGGKHERLLEIAEQAFNVITREMKKSNTNSGETQ